MALIGEILAHVAHARVPRQYPNVRFKIIQDPSGSLDAVIRHVFISPQDRAGRAE